MQRISHRLTKHGRRAGASTVQIYENWGAALPNKAISHAAGGCACVSHISATSAREADAIRSVVFNKFPATPGRCASAACVAWRPRPQSMSPRIAEYFYRRGKQCPVKAIILAAGSRSIQCAGLIPPLADR